ncbi:hypothetical protein NPIL_691201 [Nephila pilipes]|uniref:Uncharacterized protein n=1 Tax=Nephila pilipes TaxID=299642 RepID=A0A8X6TWC2_NEPPI|nr:hypothetical protein NPIL_691201 [Nephila pilipes]
MGKAHSERKITKPKRTKRAFFFQEVEKVFLKGISNDWRVLAIPAHFSEEGRDTNKQRLLISRCRDLHHFALQPNYADSRLLQGLQNRLPKSHYFIRKNGDAFKEFRGRNKKKKKRLRN